jgi:hypothetical protein
MQGLIRPAALPKRFRFMFVIVRREEHDGACCYVRVGAQPSHELVVVRQRLGSLEFNWPLPLE